MSGGDPRRRAQFPVEDQQLYAQFARQGQRIGPRAIRNQSARDLSVAIVDRAEQCRVEGSHYGTLVQCMLAKQCREALGHEWALCMAYRFCLELEVENFREFIEHAGNRGYRLRGGTVRAAAPGIETGEFLRRQLRHRTAPIGGAIHGIVVNHHQFAIAREPEIEFDPDYTGSDRAVKSREGVFRCFAARAAVTVDQQAFCAHSRWRAR